MEWVVNTTSWKRDPLPVLQEAGWTPGLFWTGDGNVASIRFRSPDRPASRYAGKGNRYFIDNMNGHFSTRVPWAFQNTNLVHNSFNLQQYIRYTTLLNMFRAARCSSSGGPIVSPQPLVSSPSVSSRTVRVLYGCLQRVTIPEAVVIQLVLLMMSSVLLETC